MLTRVTITGADDQVFPRDLVSLSETFPFVEWGILYSEKRMGQPRYPSARWLSDMPDVPMSLHLCGEAARSVLGGSPFVLEVLLRAGGLLDRGVEVARIQVNGYEPPSPGLVSVAAGWETTTFILQVREPGLLHPAAADALAAGPSYSHFPLDTTSILFDPSGGRGERPAAWPLPPEGVPMGYAGGITPDNVVETLESIGHIAAPFWIDMESGVRTDDRFDLGKVRRVLELCAPYVR
jgi:hypothetical protein